MTQGSASSALRLHVVGHSLQGPIKIENSTILPRQSPIISCWLPPPRPPWLFSNYFFLNMWKVHTKASILAEGCKHRANYIMRGVVSWERVQANNESRLPANTGDADSCTSLFLFLSLFDTYVLSRLLFLNHDFFFFPHNAYMISLFLSWVESWDRL